MDIQAWLHEQPRSCHCESGQIQNSNFASALLSPKRHYHYDTPAGHDGCLRPYSRPVKKTDTAFVCNPREARYSQAPNARSAVTRGLFSHNGASVGQLPDSPRERIAATLAVKAQVEKSSTERNGQKRIKETRAPQPPFMTKAGVNQENFQRRPRRKIRNAIHDFATGIQKRQKASKESRGHRIINKEIDTRQNTAVARYRTGTGLRLFADFEAPNAAPGRLTMGRKRSLGLFSRGKASSPIRVIDDSSSCQLEFLRKRKHLGEHDQSALSQPIDIDRSNHNLRRREPSEGSDEAIAAYFSSRKDTLRCAAMAQSLPFQTSSEIPNYSVPNPADDDDMLDQGPCEQEPRSEMPEMTERQSLDESVLKSDAKRKMTYPVSSSVLLHHPSPERPQPNNIRAQMHAQTAAVKYHLPDPRGLFDFDIRNSSSSRPTESSSLKSQEYRTRRAQLYNDVDAREGRHRQKSCFDTPQHELQLMPVQYKRSTVTRDKDVNAMSSLWNVCHNPSALGNGKRDEVPICQGSVIGERHRNSTLKHQFQW